MGIIEDHNEQIDRLILIIEGDDFSFHYNTQEDQFMIWSAFKWLQSADDSPSLADILNGVTDGPDDLGLDLYYVDEEGKQLYLIQSKFRSTYTRITRKEFDSFLELPSKLIDAEALSSIKNNDVKDFGERFRDCIDEAYSVNLIYLTTERATDQIQHSLLRWNREPLTLKHNVDVKHRVEIVDVDALVSTVDDKDVNGPISFQEKYVTDSAPNSPRSLQGRLSGMELMDLFKQHRFAMFRENPRGPLGQVKVNADILTSLESNEFRDKFHMLNNGLTAVCERFKAEEHSDSVEIEGLQIVNGCQTTYTVYTYGRDGGELDGVSVTMKLIESGDAPKLREKISRTSNSQSKMTDWDFLFNVPIQEELQREFGALNPPIFYQLKRGEQRYSAAPSKRSMKMASIKDVAKSMQAFLGGPGEAKDKPREVATSYPGGTYKDVFWDGVSAQQLYLPLAIQEKVDIRWRERNKENESEQRLSEAGLHLVWLVGRIVLGAIDSTSSDYASIPVEKVEDVRHRIDEWFDDAYSLAKFAVQDTIAHHQEGLSVGEVTLRQLFRSSTYYERFLIQLDRLKETSAGDSFKRLPELVNGTA